jgi:hypothetical protein
MRFHPFIEFSLARVCSAWVIVIALHLSSLILFAQDDKRRGDVLVAGNAA